MKSKSRIPKIKPKGTQASLRNPKSTKILTAKNLNAAIESLPPQMSGKSHGRVYLEMHNLNSLEYNSRDYCGESEANTRLFANIKFWGETGPGVYLK